MITIVQGNILNATEDIIAHQTNCMGVYASGLAKQVREAYPQAYKEYEILCDMYTADPNILLGYCQFVFAEKTIAHLFGQYDYGRDLKKVYTRYDYLEWSLDRLSRHSREEGKTVALPYNLGCGLANGSWDIVQDLILKSFANQKVVLYKFN